MNYRTLKSLRVTLHILEAVLVDMAYANSSGRRYLPCDSHKNEELELLGYLKWLPKKTDVLQNF